MKMNIKMVTSCVAVFVMLMTVIDVEAGISVHKIKGKCNSKFIGKHYFNDATKSIVSDLERDQCMKCFCDKSGKSMTCFGCSPSYVTIDEQMALLNKRCYLSESGELPQFPTCCRNTIVCDGGINAKYFSEKRFKQFEYDLQPFVEMYKLLEYLKNARQEMLADDLSDDVDYFKQHEKDTFAGELHDPSRMETVGKDEFVMPAQKQEQVDKHEFLGKSQMQQEAPAIDLVKQHRYDEKLPSKEMGFGAFEEKDEQVKPETAKPMQKLYRKPAPVAVADDIVVSDKKAARKAKMQRKFLRKLYKSKAIKFNPDVENETSEKKANDAVLKKTKPRKVKFAPIPQFQDDVIEHHANPKFAPIPAFEKSVPSKSAKFAPIPDFDEEDMETERRAPEPGFAPIPDYDLDEPESLREQPVKHRLAPLVLPASIPDQKYPDFKKMPERHVKSVSKTPEVGPSLLMDLKYVELPEDFEKSTHS